MTPLTIALQLVVGIPWLIFNVLFRYLLIWPVGAALIYLNRTKVAPRRSSVYSGFSDRVMPQFTAPYMWLWCNEEDGVDGLRGGSTDQSWWLEKTKELSTEQRIYKWSALRNPQNNLRYVPLVNGKFFPTNRIKTVWTSPKGGFLVIRGIYLSFWLNFSYKGKSTRFWIGWKYKPGDEAGVEGTRLPRPEFALQLKYND